MRGRPALSSNTLFHFTRDRDTVLSILSDRFRPSYCVETFASIAEGLQLAIPMVCFCDIPLSQTAAHVETYGRYGIGLKKSWGISWGISPVLYITQESETTRTIDRTGAVLNTLGEAHPAIEDLRSAQQELLFLFGFVKPYVGPAKRPDGTLEEVLFYNEREWRYVPRGARGAPNVILGEAYFNPETRSRAKEEILNAGPSFEPADIRYLIVSRDSEIPEMVKRIRDIARFTAAQADLLASRIVSVEQIEEDF